MDDIAAFDRGLQLLMSGALRDAWPFWERRPSRANSPMHRFTVPEWRGEDLAGRHIFLVGEQGLGDEIMFARFVPLVRALGPAKITLAVLEPNIRAMAELADQVVYRANIPRMAVDCWCLLGSLPVRFNTDLETIPPPFLPAIERRDGGGVGFVGQGQPANPKDALRSLPLGTLIPGTRPLSARGDILDSFSQVADLDLLVSVDTAWAHIGGSLGKPTWLLVSELALDWRWMRAWDNSPWYPSMRLFRRAQEDSWGDVLERVRTAMSARAGRPDEHHD